MNTFVSNRVSEIQILTESVKWRHIKSQDNPADAISRGQLPRAFIQNETWATGPKWLVKNNKEWPDGGMNIIELPELKKNACFVTTCRESEIFERISSYSKLIRVIAYCRRLRPANKYTGALVMKEIDEAEILIIKKVQNAQYSEEIKSLTKAERVLRGRITNLSPFLDDNGLLRVEGRLRQSNLNFSHKHPILLPNRHSITNRIIRETHERYHHAGIQTTLYFMRQKFWIVDGRNQCARSSELAFVAPVSTPPRYSIR